MAGLSQVQGHERDAEARRRSGHETVTGKGDRNGNRSTDPKTPAAARALPGAAGAEYLHYTTDRIELGDRSFPNKRILRNNLCLPA